MDLSRLSPSVRGARLYALYGALAGTGAALTWPDGKALDWKFFVGIVYQICLAWKALQSTSPIDQPHDAPKVKPAEPAPDQG